MPGERGSGLIVQVFIFFILYLGEWGEKGFSGLLLGGDIGLGRYGMGGFWIIVQNGWGEGENLEPGYFF